MFCDLDRARFPVARRTRGIALGALVMIGVAAALIAPRTTPFTLAATFVGLCIVAAAHGGIRSAIPRITSRVVPLMAFLGFAFASAAWAEAPQSTLMMTGGATLLALGTVALSQWFEKETQANLTHIAEGAWLGYLCGLVYIFAEVLSHQAIKVSIFNFLELTAADVPHPERYSWNGTQLVSVSLEELTRNIAPTTGLLWPAAFIVRKGVAPKAAMFISAAMVIMCGAVVFMSWNGTSKVAFLAGLVCFLGALLKPVLFRRLLQIGWVTACLGVVPLALIAHKLDLHNATWIEGSARHRIIIWNFTAHQVFDAPLLGIGARSTYTLGPRQEETIEDRPGEVFRRTLSKHSHSIYLQTWLELGLIGAVLLTIAGLSIIGAIALLPASAQPFALAAFASSAAMAASSYGMWQLWFVAMFGFAYLLVTAGVQLRQSSLKDGGLRPAP